MIKHCFGRKHHYLLVIMLLAFSTSALAQSEYRTDKWRFSDPKQFGFSVIDVQFYDNNLGIAVGGNGGIARSIDGGANWTYGPFTFTSPAGLKTNGTFNDVHIPTATVAYAVGSNGMMAKSTDAGKNWTFVNTPLYAKAVSINAVWFVNKDTGYIGGLWNTSDSIPKLYVTKNGGSTWDSINAPIGGKTRVGYINNPNAAPIIWDVTAKAKVINRIIFTSPSNGYVVGGSNSGQNYFPRIPSVNAPTATTNPCQVSGATTSTGSADAALVWKFSNGSLIDYSLSKERLGFSGINTNTVLCNTLFGSVQGQTGNYIAAHVISDSALLLMSSNNNYVIRVNTGKNDSTVNMATGNKENGVYVLLNFVPPTQGPQAGLPIPNPQVLFTSANPYHIKKASNGKLYASAGGGAMWTSVDTGRNWKKEFSLPQGKKYSGFSTWAIEFLPNGKLITMGQGGVMADSIPGGAFKSNYVFVGSGGNRVDFTDCNNGIVTGGSAIAVTIDGGNNWINKDRADFASSFYSINGFHYTQLNKCYFAVSNGIIYSSPDKATTLDPLFSDFNFQMNAVQGFGNDTVYAVGYSQSSVPTASRKSSFFRTTNAGATWQTVDIVANTVTPAFTAPTLSKMSFPSRNVGYAAGTRNGVYKTTDGGSTWTKINPFPALNENIGGAYVSYTSIFALDDNTVFVLGNIFTTAGFKRLYKTTDGGATWTDISGSINTQLPVGNMLNVLFSDANNGYVSGSNVLFVTNNSGASWTMEVAPEGNLHNAMGFAPRTVPAAIPFANRKLFIGTLSFGSGIPSIMEYGDTLNVNVNAAQVVTNATCTNPTAGSITVNATGGISPYAYSINGGAFQPSNVFTGLTQGTKTILIKDAFCGLISRTVNVGFTDNLTLTTNNDTTVCAGAPVPMQATSAATSYAWTPASGLSSASTSNPVATVNANTAYTVTASLNGCVRSKVVTISTKANPFVSAGPDQLIINGDVVTLTGSGTATPVSIAWTPVATLTSGGSAYVATAKPTATTTYTLTVKDNNGCTSTDDAVITVLPYCVKVMNAFTPNGDGVNDKWLVTSGGSCTSDIAVNVFNRYGGLVYSNEHYQNDWNGTYKGKPVADGTYYYVIKYKLVTGSGLQLKGDLTILR